MLPSQTSGDRAPHGRTVPAEGGAGGGGRSRGAARRGQQVRGPSAQESAGRPLPRPGSRLTPGLRCAHMVPTSSSENEHITHGQGPGAPRGDHPEPRFKSASKPGETFPAPETSSVPSSHPDLVPPPVSPVWPFLGQRKCPGDELKARVFHSRLGS